MTRTRVIGAVAVVTALGGGLLVGRHHTRSAAASPGPAPVATATVRRTNLAATQLVDATLGYTPSQPVLVRRTGTYTSLPSEGTVVGPGEPLARVDDRPVILLIGTVAAWRPFGLGMTDGPDVEQLERGLTFLGFGAGRRGDSHFSAATEASVRRWQAALGEPVTGVVENGDVVFLPTAVRVGHLAAAIGGPAQPGQAPYLATSTTRVVHAALDASRQGGIALGSPVTVDLPGGTKAPGKVSGLGRVASSPPENTNGGGGSRPTVSLDVSLDDPKTGGDLDQVPVGIEIVTDSATNALAVPVAALLALAEGGYGVEVVPPDGPHRIVAVTPGLFASGLVQIGDGDLPTGTVVAVAR